MFSIIIPLYNKAAYIEKAIQSVLAQTYQEFEIIVVDDGSTDDGWAKVQSLKQTLNHPIGGWGGFSQPNQGVSTARNNGVKQAKYDYIAFLDADDWWASTYLEHMKGLIEEFPEAGIFASSYFKVKNGQNILAKIGVDVGFERGLINYCRAYSRSLYQPLWTGAVIIKKSIFDSENGFKPRLKMGEDFDLWVRVAIKYPVALLNKPLAYYNQDVDLINRAIGEKLYEPEQHMLFSDYSEFNDNPDFRKMYEKLAVYGLMPYYLADKNKKEVDLILKDIHWENHSFKYRIQYKILPKFILKVWLQVLNVGFQLKVKLLK